MATRFTSGKYSIALCDRCGMKYPLRKLRKLTIKTKVVDLKVCPECWETDHPQYRVGMYPVHDAQAVREPRTDSSYITSGINANGDPSGGSRSIQWGWNPLGGASGTDAVLTPNNLVASSAVGSVVVVLS